MNSCENKVGPDQRPDEAAGAGAAEDSFEAGAEESRYKKEDLNAGDADFQQFEVRRRVSR